MESVLNWSMVISVNVAAPHPGNTVKQADPHDNFHSGRFLFARFREVEGQHRRPGAEEGHLGQAADQHSGGRRLDGTHAGGVLRLCAVPAKRL